MAIGSCLFIRPLRGVDKRRGLTKVRGTGSSEKCNPQVGSTALDHNRLQGFPPFSKQRLFDWADIQMSSISAWAELWTPWGRVSLSLCPSLPLSIRALAHRTCPPHSEAAVVTQRGSCWGRWLGGILWWNDPRHCPSSPRGGWMGTMRVGGGGYSLYQDEQWSGSHEAVNH